MPSFIIGVSLVTFVYIVELGGVLNIPSLYRVISSMGISLILFSIFVLIEEYEIFKTKKNHKFIFYYSYYSLTIYIAHNLLFFLFFGLLNIPILVLLISLTIFLLGLLLKWLYEKTSSNFAVKVIIGKLAHRIVKKAEERKAINSK
jgi:hypothetical protein